MRDGNTAESLCGRSDHLKRRLFNILTAVSLALCMAIMFFWFLGGLSIPSEDDPNVQVIVALDSGWLRIERTETIVKVNWTMTLEQAEALWKKGYVVSPGTDISTTKTTLTSYEFPFWWIVPALLALPILWFCSFVRRELWLVRCPVVACLTCGYDLTGNVSGVCPECGKAKV